MTTDPVPQSVIVTETSSETAGGSSYGTSAAPTGGCASGLGGSMVQMTDTPGGGNPPAYVSGTSSAGMTRYTTQSGASTISLTCSPSSQATATGGEQLSLRYTATVTPVTISLGGTTADSSGNQDILVGQQCTASIGGIPAALLQNTANPPVYSWTATSTASTLTPFTSPSTAASPNWYWNDMSQTNETVTCTVMLTPPSGDGSAFSVTATKKVEVMLPTWSCSGTGGQMYIGSGYDSKNPGDYYLYAGPASGAGRGMSWAASVAAPSGTSFGTGTLEMVQLLTPSEFYTAGGSSYKQSNNGQQGLDTSYPTAWDANSSPSLYTGGDSPGLEVTGTSSVSLANQFMDYVMYMPPGTGSQWVTLGTLSWKTNGSATLPGSKNWADAVGPAGTVMPSGKTNFSAVNTFPSWTQNTGNGTGTWVMSP